MWTSCGTLPRLRLQPSCTALPGGLVTQAPEQGDHGPRHHRRPSRQHPRACMMRGAASLKGRSLAVLPRTAATAPTPPTTSRHSQPGVVRGYWEARASRQEAPKRGVPLHTPPAFIPWALRPPRMHSQGRASRQGECPGAVQRVATNRGPPLPGQGEEAASSTPPSVSLHPPGLCRRMPRSTLTMTGRRNAWSALPQAPQTDAACTRGRVHGRRTQSLWRRQPTCSSPGLRSICCGRPASRQPPWCMCRRSWISCDIPPS
mmetsp:Transcript_5133/g.14768  ORF Transcript_5133/g.14768 Transcript_5133/m.14768 type:complete len:260 (+) Transcript_5133:698-1477(+)